MQQDILLVIISNSGDTVRLAELAKMANDHHIDVIAFVGQKFKIGSLATLTISTETYTPKESPITNRIFLWHNTEPI